MGKISVEDDKIMMVSLPGKDANTSDPEDMALRSGFDYPKIEENLVGVIDYTVPTGTSTNTYTVATITHNLGYIPCFQCFVQDLDGITPSQFATLPLSDGYTYNYFTAYTTTTTLVIQYVVIEGGWAPPTWPGYDFRFKYQIWVND